MTVPVVHRFDALSCPSCRETLSAAGALSSDASPPEAGDVTICAACRGVLVFEDAGGSLSLRPLTAAELMALDEQMRTELAIVRSYLDTAKKGGCS